MFQEVIDEHLHPGRPKPKQDDIIDVLMAIPSKHQSYSFGEQLLSQIFKGF